MRSASAVPRVSVVLVIFGLFVGCAPSPKVIFTKSGVSAADRERDENACLRSSIGLDDQSRIMVPFDVDRNAFQSCMAARGYTATARP